LDVTACGQTVPAGNRAVLQTDRVCSDGDPAFNAGVTIERAGRLDLNGHSITMVDDGGNLAGVACTSSCRVHNDSLNPARISGGANPPVRTVGVVGYAPRITNVEIEGFDNGVQGHRVTTSNVVISDCQRAGIEADRATIIDTQISGCAGGVVVDLKAKGKDSIISANDSVGIEAGQMLNGSGLVITNNGSVGVDAIAGRNNHPGKIKLRSSQVTGHGVDLQSSRRPILRDTTCDTSERFDPETFQSTGTSWGACAND
jgi:hypothetical protein